jgi:hypothetical protein
MPPYSFFLPIQRAHARQARAWQPAALLVLLLGLGAAQAMAKEMDLTPKDRFSLLLAPHTHHYRQSVEHKGVYLFGFERIRNQRDVSGLTLFTNSFGQPSTFIYPWGRVYSGLMPQAPNWYLKWGAGLLYGYKEPYNNKVPMNANGFSPGVVVGLGRPVSDRMGLQLNLLGNAALMFQASFYVP